MQGYLVPELIPFLDPLLNSYSPHATYDKVGLSKPAESDVNQSHFLPLVPSSLRLPHPGTLLNPRRELLGCQVYLRCLHSLTYAITSVLLPSTLQSFPLHISSAANPNPELKQAAAELILRCGPPLARLEVEFELPESAILHLMSLPNLIFRGASQPACTDSAYLIAPAAYDRFLRGRTPRFGDPSSVRLALLPRPSRWWRIPLTLTTPPAKNALYAPAFSNLTHFDMDVSGRHGCFGSCASLPTNSDIPLLADTLPHLEWLYLGQPCGHNTGQTTFRSLHTPARCLRLRSVCIHLNTTALVQDILSIFEEQERRSETDGQNSKRNRKMRRHRPLKLLFAHDLLLELRVDVEGLEVVWKGLFDIFIVIDDGAPMSDLSLRCKFWTTVFRGIETLQARESFAVKPLTATSR
jgi:hypothetical protein